MQAPGFSHGVADVNSIIDNGWVGSNQREKENNIVVYEYKWKKKGKNILIWCKENDGIIEAFSSVEYKGNIKF